MALLRALPISPLEVVALTPALAQRHSAVGGAPSASANAPLEMPCTVWYEIKWSKVLMALSVLIWSRWRGVKMFDMEYDVRLCCKKVNAAMVFI